MQKKYNISYLPRSRFDIIDIVEYIVTDLGNPKAAEDFMVNLDEKIGRLSEFPFIGAVYKWNHKFDYDYRMIFVGNYTVFYTVYDEVVEIHRVIYSARNMSELL